LGKDAKESFAKGGDLADHETCLDVAHDDQEFVTRQARQGLLRA